MIEDDEDSEIHFENCCNTSPVMRTERSETFFKKPERYVHDIIFVACPVCNLESPRLKLPYDMINMVKDAAELWHWTLSKKNRP